MHNQPLQPLSDLETLREENERLREELTAHIHSEASLYSAAIWLLKFVGTATDTGKPSFIGSTQNIQSALQYVKNSLDESERLENRYNTTQKQDDLFLEPDPTLD